MKQIWYFLIVWILLINPLFNPTFVALSAESRSSPQAPSNLTASVFSSSQINLNWNDNSTNETVFKIERKVDTSGSYVQIATVSLNTKSFSNKGLTPNTKYFYRIRAANFRGNSSYSNEASATTPANPTAPNAPSNLSANVMLSSQINLTWIDNSTNETSFKIERRTGSVGSYTQIASVGANISSYNNIGLTAGTKYFYRVRSSNSIGDSAYSNEANATTLSPPDAQPPTVTMTSPQQSANISGIIMISANAADNVGVAGVQFLVDGGIIQTEDQTAPYSISFDTLTISTGIHSFSAQAKDAAGNIGNAFAIMATVVRSNTGNPPVISGCQIFPTDNPWNRDISNDPLDPNSNTYINTILGNDGNKFLHADFGSDPNYGIPYVVVPGNQPQVPITFTDYGDESDPGPYPVPANAPIEGGPTSDGDRHVLVLNSGNCKLYELYNAFKDANGSGWSASSGAIFDLNSNALRPDTWTSADAAGLPILPGLIRYDEVTAGEIRHAIRFTVKRVQKAWIHPATHYGTSTNPNDPPYGARFRLKANFDLSNYHGQSRVILEAMKKYGMMLADQGTSWFVTGASDTRWNDDDLNQLKSIPGSMFEVVQSGPIIRP